MNGRDTIAHACLFSVHNRICHRKLKMQSDWSHLVRGAGTTRCIALYQTLSLPFPLRPLFPERESGCARLIDRWVVILLTVTVLAGAGQGTPPPPPPPPPAQTAYSYKQVFSQICSQIRVRSSYQSFGCYAAITWAWSKFSRAITYSSTPPLLEVLDPPLIS